MRATEPLRLALIALLVLLVQLALYLVFPAWRAGLDPFLILLLLLATARGPFLAGVFALLGGVLMDAYSDQLISFHVIYYLVPVAVGAMIRSQLIVEYHFLGTLTVFALLLGKVLAQYLSFFIMGHVDSPAFLLRVNYWSILLMTAIVYICWRWLVRLVPFTPGVQRRVF
jgi:hypothetical protein